jgi:hypothetical protein
MSGRLMRVLFLFLVWGVCSLPAPVLACTSCYGQSDSPLAHGMNMGILTLLCVIGSVLFGISAFFVYLARRSAALAARPSDPLLESTQKL